MTHVRGDSNTPGQPRPDMVDGETHNLGHIGAGHEVFAVQSKIKNQVCRMRRGYFYDVGWLSHLVLRLPHDLWSIRPDSNRNSSLRRAVPCPLDDGPKNGGPGGN